MSSAQMYCLSIEQAMEFIGDRQGVQGLLVTLEESLAKDLPDIQRRLEAGDLPGMNRLLHQFKGFAPVFCVPSLVDEIVRVEGLSKGTDLAGVREAYAALAPRLHQLLEEVRSHLADGP